MVFDKNFVEWPDRSKAIDLFRMISILCVILTHIPFTYSMGIETFGQVWSSNFALSPAENFIIFLKFGLGRVASPALSLVSAWFLLRTLDKKNFPDIAKSKSQNLLIPYLFWCLIDVAFFLLVMALFGRDPYGFKDHFWTSLYDSTFNLYKWPNNGPLHYLLDLFEIIIFYSFFHKFFDKNRWALVSLTIVSPFLMLYFGASESWLGDNLKSLLPRADLVFYFFIGVLTFKNYETLFSDKTVNFLTNKAVLALLVLASFLASKFIFYYNDSVSTDVTLEGVLLFYVTLFLRAICSLLIFATALLIYIKWRPAVSRRMVFRIFCSHAIIIWIANGVMNDIFSDDYLAMRYIATFLGAVLGGCIVSKVMDMLAAKFPMKIWKYI